MLELVGRLCPQSLFSRLYKYDMSSPKDILLMPSGAEWLKADLHVHTPASDDMGEEWKEATPKDVVDIAIDKGLDVIAITDHNTAAWCDQVRDAASGSKLTVLPGVELSTPEGHLLALFDTDVSATHIEDLLVRVGIKRENFGDLHVATTEGVVGVCSEIAKAHGVAIAAHADGSRGFLKMISVGATRKLAYVCTDLWAIEILDLSSKQEHQSGGRYERRMTCLQSSDCWPTGADHHQLDGMAQRYSFLKMSERSLSGLKLALIDPEIRVRLADDEWPSVNDSILGMWITRGFLDTEVIRFNENVSCFIGDTGSGKSVATELLRFGLDQQARVPKIKAEVGNMLKQQLGDLGTVHILLSKGDSKYLVERTWGTPPEPSIVRRMDETGLHSVEQLDIGRFFPIKGFSQSEIIEFAREPEIRLSLTDDLIDCSIEKSTIKHLKETLRQNTSAILTEQAKQKNAHEQLLERAGLLEKIREINNVLNDPRVEAHQLWYDEQKLFSDAKKKVEEFEQHTTDFMAPFDLSSLWPEDITAFPNRHILEQAKNAKDNWQGIIEEVRLKVETELNVISSALSTLEDEWSVLFEKEEDEYRDLLAQLDKENVGLQALSEVRRSVQERVSWLDDIEKNLSEEIEPNVAGLQQERQNLLDDLQRNRNAITAKRKQKANDLGKKLGYTIRLKVHGRANIKDFRNGVQILAQGSHVQGSDIDKLASNSHPVSFTNRLLSADIDGLAELCGLESTKISKIWDTIVDRERLSDLYELQLTDVEDIVDIQLQVAEGKYRTLEELSHGQKCMVILMVALAEGEFPLIVDQPEDALHAPGIEEGIVSTLRSGRGTRQCIFATRNANILVSADAEQIIALQADAQRGRVAGTGSMDKFGHRQLIMYHVEGGEEAFQRRRTMYTLEPAM